MRPAAALLLMACSTPPPPGPGGEPSATTETQRHEPTVQSRAVSPAQADGHPERTKPHAAASPASREPWTEGSLHQGLELRASGLRDHASADSTTDIAEALASRRDVDQWLRTVVQQVAAESGMDSDLYRNARETLKRIDAENCSYVESVLQQHGWVRSSVFGRSAAFNAWLLVQHCDARPDFQLQALELMEVAVRDGDARAQDLALLTDRVYVNAGRQQLYGSQGRCTNGSWVPLSIAVDSEVEDRRASVGLQSLQDYASHMSKKCSAY